MITDSGHQEFLCFFFLYSPMFTLILGVPWLRAHNPKIDWSKGEIMFSNHESTVGSTVLPLNPWTRPVA